MAFYQRFARYKLQRNRNFFFLQRNIGMDFHSIKGTPLRSLIGETHENRKNHSGNHCCLIPNLCAFADNAQTVNSSTVQSPGAGSGQPTSWGQSMNTGNRPMHPELKASKQDVNHTNVQSTNATTTPSTSSSLSPSAAIKTNAVLKVRSQNQIELLRRFEVKVDIVSAPNTLVPR